MEILDGAEGHQIGNSLVTRGAFAVGTSNLNELRDNCRAGSLKGCQPLIDKTFGAKPGGLRALQPGALRKSEKPIPKDFGTGF